MKTLKIDNFRKLFMLVLLLVCMFSTSVLAQITEGLNSVNVYPVNVSFTGDVQALTAVIPEGQEKADEDSEYVLLREQKDKLGYRHFRMEQRYKGIAVIGAQLVFHVNSSGMIYYVSGKNAPGLDISVKPALSEESALQIGLDDQADVSNKEVTRDPALVIINTRLAYHFVISSKLDSDPAQVHYFVGAQTGDIIHKYDNIQYTPLSSVSSHVTVDGNRLSGEDGSNVSMEGWKQDGGNYFLFNTGTGSTAGKWGIYDTDAFAWEQNPTSSWGSSDPASISAGKNIEDTQEYVTDVLGRDSFDDGGAFARLNVHEGFNYVNAYWDGSDFHFGDGDGVTADPLTTLDIVAHEYGHAITDYTSDLIYSYESGALNESFSDILGGAVEFHVQFDGTSSYPSSNPGESDFLMGEDCWLSKEALRDMRNPHRYQDPSCYKGTHWYTGSGDNGGVHTNSGVQNFVYYLLAEGGTGNNDGNEYNITGLGREAAAEIAMRANTVYLVPSSQYADSRDAWIQAADDLNHDIQTVVDVWDAAWCEETPIDSPSGQVNNYTLGNWVLCKNRTTGSGWQPGGVSGSSWDCGGLTTYEGDEVLVILNGNAGDQSPSGQVGNYTLSMVLCKNRTTGSAWALGGISDSSWDCGSLATSNGDEVRVILIGESSL